MRFVQIVQFVLRRVAVVAGRQGTLTGALGDREQIAVGCDRVGSIVGRGEDVHFAHITIVIRTIRVQMQTIVQALVVLNGGVMVKVQLIVMMVGLIAQQIVHAIVKMQTVRVLRLEGSADRTSRVALERTQIAAHRGLVLLVVARQNAGLNGRMTSVQQTFHLETMLVLVVALTDSKLIDLFD